MDSETRRTMKQLIEEVKLNENTINGAQYIESFTDQIYDLAYRKGWHDGYWRQDADLSYQTAFLKKRTRKRNDLLVD